VEWHHPTSSRKKKFKAIRAAREVMATYFGDAEGMMLVDVMSRGEIITSDL
jgi:hypothetical protein